MSIEYICKQNDFITASLIDIADLQTKIKLLPFTNNTLQYISTSDNKNTVYTLVFANVLIKTDKQILSNFIATYTYTALASNICLIKDNKLTNTNGGTFTQNVWNLRTLTTLVGLVNFATLNNNQITLTVPGYYSVIIKAPACNVQGHQARLNNVTDGVMQYGTNAYATTVSTALGGAQVVSVTTSEVTSIFSITKPTVFQVEHMCALTVPGFGFGKATGFSVEEIYTSVVIEIISRT